MAALILHGFRWTSSFSLKLTIKVKLERMFLSLYQGLDFQYYSPNVPYRFPRSSSSRSLAAQLTDSIRRFQLTHQLILRRSALPDQIRSIPDRYRLVPERCQKRYTEAILKYELRRPQAVSDNTGTPYPHDEPIVAQMRNMNLPALNLPPRTTLADATIMLEDRHSSAHTDPQMRALLRLKSLLPRIPEAEWGPDIMWVLLREQKA